MRYIFLTALFAAAANPACAQDEADIYRLWDGFVASSAAFEKCGPDDALLRQKFAASFLAVASQAAEQSRADHPFNPARDLENAMEGRRKAIRVKVEDEIARNGCASAGIKELLELYKANAERVQR